MIMIPSITRKNKHRLFMDRYFHKELEAIRSKLILIGEKANEAGFLAV